MLRLIRIEDAPGEVRWSIEKATTGVVLVDVDVVGAGVAAPLHWRAGTWTKPPLDVSLDARGELTGFQFVFQDEGIGEAAGTPFPDPEPGRPVFDVEGWPPNRYSDETSEVHAGRLPSGELLLRIADADRPACACLLGGTLALGFDGDGALTVIRIGPLSHAEWETIEAAAPGEAVR